MFPLEFFNSSPKGVKGNLLLFGPPGRVIKILDFFHFEGICNNRP